MKSATITLQRDAPAKPRLAEPCNGCGVCCAARLCPAALLLLKPRHAPCPALEWQPEPQRRYVCGLLRQPRHYLGWLPRWLEQPLRRRLHRSIAAGQGCDCTIEVE